MDLHRRRELMETMSKRYRQASRASKNGILDEGGGHGQQDRIAIRAREISDALVDDAC